MKENISIISHKIRSPFPLNEKVEHFFVFIFKLNYIGDFTWDEKGLNIKLNKKL